MGTTQPIRDKKELKKFMEYYLTNKINLRNYALIILGLHTALRISDILHLQWKDIYYFQTKTYHEHLQLYEKKTGKASYIAVNKHIKDALELYRLKINPQPEDYIFSKRTNPSYPLSRSQAYRITKKAAKETLFEKNISCHSLRKTFGYHAWKQGTSPVLLMDIYNHSSFHITKRYLGIEQDERDSIFMDIDL